MSTHNIGFYEELTKIIYKNYLYHQIPLNMHHVFCHKALTSHTEGSIIEP